MGTWGGGGPEAVGSSVGFVGAYGFLICYYWEFGLGLAQVCSVICYLDQGLCE